jgi:hypothetical protein
MLTNLRLTDLSLTTVQQRTTGQNAVRPICASCHCLKACMDVIRNRSAPGEHQHSDFKIAALKCDLQTTLRCFSKKAVTILITFP